MDERDSTHKFHNQLGMNRLASNFGCKVAGLDIGPRFEQISLLLRRESFGRSRSSIALEGYNYPEARLKF